MTKGNLVKFKKEVGPMCQIDKCRRYISLILIITFLLVGCSDNVTSRTVTTSTEGISEPSFTQQLSISVASDPNMEYWEIPQESLSGIYDGDIKFFNLSEVNIQIGETYLPLEDAIRDGHISPEEIIAYARIDARNGFCQEHFQSELGYTRFVYAYPEYEIHYSYDVFEASDGTHHLIKNFAFHTSDSYTHVGYDIYVSNDAGETVSLYSEDWGLTFDILYATPTGITINCKQSGGMHADQLLTSHFNILSTADEGSFLSRLNSQQNAFPQIYIQQNTESQINLDWTDIYGQLPKGEYELQLFIKEEYDSSVISKLQKNYTDLQCYVLTFTIH